MSADTRPAAAPATRRGYGKIALGVVLATLVIAFFALGGHRYLSLDAVKTHRDALLAFTHEHYLAALAIAFVTYVTATALSLPGGLVLSLTMGFLFGRWVAGTVLRRQSARPLFLAALPLRRARAAARCPRRSAPGSPRTPSTTSCSCGSSRCFRSFS